MNILDTFCLWILDIWGKGKYTTISLKCLEASFEEGQKFIDHFIITDQNKDNNIHEKNIPINEHKNGYRLREY